MPLMLKYELHTLILCAFTHRHDFPIFSVGLQMHTLKLTPLKKGLNTNYWEVRVNQTTQRLLKKLSIWCVSKETAQTGKTFAN